MLNASQKTHEPRRLHRGVDIQGAGQMRRLIGHDAHRATAQPREAHDDVPREMLMHFEQHAVVHDRTDDVDDVVGLIG